MAATFPRTTVGRDAQEAASPVIGVLLMLAITAVVASTIFIVINSIGADQSAALPNVEFDPSESEDRAVITTASPDARWEQLEVRLSAAGGFALNGVAATGIAADSWTPVGTGPIYASDYIHVCADVEGPMVIEVRYVERNTIMGGFEFGSVALC